MSISQLNKVYFHKIQNLGKGGYANVYLAKFAKSGARCAMKIINKDLIGSDFLILQLELEIKALKTFQIDTIPYLYGIYISANN